MTLDLSRAALNASRFDAAIAQHRAALVTHAARMVGPDDAEDMVQDALVKAWRRLPDFDGYRQGPDYDRAMRAWLYKATQNRSRDWLDHTHVLTMQPYLAELHADLRHTPGDAPLEGVAARQELAALLAFLTPRERFVLVWAAQGETARQIGVRCGVSRVAAKTWLSRARQRALAWRVQWDAAAAAA